MKSSQSFGIAAVLCLSGAAAAAPMLLIPDSSSSGGRRVMAFSPVDGSVINLNLIPNDGRFQTPKDAFDSGRGTILVSDQVSNAVFEYSTSGAYIQTIVNSTQISNPRGATVYNNQLYVTVGTTPGNTVQRFNLDGSGQTTWGSGFTSPFDIYFRDNDALVTNFVTSVSQATIPDLMTVPLAGGAGSQFALSLLAGASQINPLSNGNVIVAGFSSGPAPGGAAGLYEFDASTGAQVNFYQLTTGPRGAYELQNGLLLFTDATGVRTYNRATGVTTTIVSGPNAQYIEYMDVPAPATAALFAFAPAAMLRRRRRA